jgi:hypothetical protein
MERGKTYTENEMEEIEFLEEEIKTIFYRDYIPDSLVIKATKMINKWKQLTNWKEAN